MSLPELGRSISAIPRVQLHICSATVVFALVVLPTNRGIRSWISLVSHMCVVVERALVVPLLAKAGNPGSAVKYVVAPALQSSSIVL